MKVRYVLFLLTITLFSVSCRQNSMSKVPQIKLKSFGPESVIVNEDTAFLVFDIQDGDADIGRDHRGNVYDIFIKDRRYNTGFSGYFFPYIDKEVLDPGKGLNATCEFLFEPFLLIPREDSIHLTTRRDTVSFEVYIMDLAGNTSNHITTPDLIIEIP